MRWLLNQDAFKFTPGDILIKKTRSYSYNPHNRDRQEEWVTEVITKTTGAPKKYVYAFENKLGIGYIRQLKANGEGYCGTLICVANFDPDNTRFELDPDFVDHTLIGEGEFSYNQEYANKKKFRQDAMDANRKIMEKTSSKRGLRAWYLSLKPGDVFWFGNSFDELCTNKYVVKRIIKASKPKPNTSNSYYNQGVDRKTYANGFLEDNEWQTVEVEVLENSYHKPGTIKLFEIGVFSWAKVTMVQPHPMKDQLCGQPK